jgi:hypothetical protein
MIQDEKVDEGIKRVHQGIDIRRAAGAALVHSSFYAILAECYGWKKGVRCRAGNDSRRINARGTMGRAKLKIRVAPCARRTTAVQVAGRKCSYSVFRKGDKVARGQDAKLFELRASQSLARLWQGQGKRQEAYDLLAPIYNWFTEGFATRELTEAKALLDERWPSA